MKTNLIGNKIDKIDFFLKLCLIHLNALMKYFYNEILQFLKSYKVSTIKVEKSFVSKKRFKVESRGK